MAIDVNGEIIGSVSGGCIEGAVISEGIKSIKDGKTRVKDYGISNNLAWEVGLACGGELKILVQPLNIEDSIVNSMVAHIKNRQPIKLEVDCITGERLINNSLTNEISYYNKLTNQFIHVLAPHPRLFIIGAVHIAQALVSLGKIANYDVTLIDPREHFATKKRFPDCKIINEWPDTALANFKLDKATHIVTLTHDPKIDDPALITALKHDIGYIGSLGSKKTHQKRCERLLSIGFKGDELIEHVLTTLPGGQVGALIIVMLAIFFLGFFLDYIEIIFVIVPLVGPVLIANGADPLWLGIMISLNLQTSFLTPPFGFSLFFLRGVAPPEIQTKNIYRGVLPYIGIQVLALIIVGFIPEIATWLPRSIF
jgi:xanthine dehydrogenase accessory factor